MLPNESVLHDERYPKVWTGKARGADRPSTISCDQGFGNIRVFGMRSISHQILDSHHHNLSSTVRSPHFDVWGSIWRSFLRWTTRAYISDNSMNQITRAMLSDECKSGTTSDRHASAAFPCSPPRGKAGLAPMGFDASIGQHDDLEERQRRVRVDRQRFSR